MTRIKRLIVFAGPPCSGKSTILGKLQTGNLPWLCTQLELGDPALWRYVESREMHALPALQANKIILHYDFLRPFQLGLPQGDYAQHKPLGILDRCDEITFVTLWAAPKTLIERLQTRQVAQCKSHLKSLNLRLAIGSIRTLRLLRPLYLNPVKLMAYYPQWFKFCSTYQAKSHWIMDTMGDVPKLSDQGLGLI